MKHSATQPIYSLQWQGVMDLCLSVSVWWLVSSVVVTGDVPGFVFYYVEFCVYTFVSFF